MAEATDIIRDAMEDAKSITTDLLEGSGTAVDIFEDTVSTAEHEVFLAEFENIKAELLENLKSSILDDITADGLKEVPETAAGKALKVAGGAVGVVGLVAWWRYHNKNGKTGAITSITKSDTRLKVDFTLDDGTSTTMIKGDHIHITENGEDTLNGYFGVPSGNPPVDGNGDNIPNTCTIFDPRENTANTPSQTNLGKIAITADFANVFFDTVGKTLDSVLNLPGNAASFFDKWWNIVLVVVAVAVALTLVAFLVKLIRRG